MAIKQCLTVRALFTIPAISFRGVDETDMMDGKVMVFVVQSRLRPPITEIYREAG